MAACEKITLRATRSPLIFKKIATSKTDTMKRSSALLTFIGCMALAASPFLTGCNKRKLTGSEKQTTTKEFLPATLGLPAGTENLGPDELGRHWYETSGANAEHWMYDPKDRTLYTATKDEKSGEWKLKAKMEITAGSLGLGADTVELGKDPNGLYWFELPAKDERVAYNPMNKTLYTAKKDAAGNWELGVPVAKP